MSQVFKSITVGSTTGAALILDSLQGNTYLTGFAAHASSANTGTMYLVNSSGRTTDGYALVPGQREAWSYIFPGEAVDANDFYVWGSDTGDIMTVTAVTGRR